MTAKCICSTAPQFHSEPSRGLEVWLPGEPQRRCSSSSDQQPALAQHLKVLGRRLLSPLCQDPAVNVQDFFLWLAVPALIHLLPGERGQL